MLSTVSAPYYILKPESFFILTAVCKCCTRQHHLRGLLQMYLGTVGNLLGYVYVPMICNKCSWLIQSLCKLVQAHHSCVQAIEHCGTSESAFGPRRQCFGTSPYSRRRRRLQ
jgi:hypothetical protein